MDGAQNTDRYAGYLGDGLHPLDAADGDLGDPESAGDVRPLLTCPRALHSTTLVIKRCIGTGYFITF